MGRFFKDMDDWEEREELEIFKRKAERKAKETEEAYKKRGFF